MNDAVAQKGLVVKTEVCIVPTLAHLCRLVILDVADSWGKDLPAEGLIEKFYPVDFSEGEAAVKACLDTITRVKQVAFFTRV